MNYYNEFDLRAAAWLQELINDKQIPDGKIDTRSIKDVTANDVHGFTQCHFFAGIGGWPLALKLAGWPEDRPVWTGSCPCQPFSTAGKQRGTEDERHLWPEFFRLIKAYRPLIAFGEQVEGAIKHGWLDGVFADLEGEGYSTGATVLGAHSVSAPHIRQRLYWVADANGDGRHKTGLRISKTGNDGAIGNGKPCGMGNANEPGLQGRGERSECSGKVHPRASSAWGNFHLLPMRDGKTRRIESGSFPLAHGVPGRVGLLRGYGNAIVPQVAAEFIQAYLDICQHFTT